MGRLLVSIVGAGLLMCLVSGCDVSTTTATITATQTALLTIEESIAIDAGQEFTIDLESYKQAGNEWYITHDSNMLELVERTYKPDWTYTPGGPIMVGGGGVESFRFKSLANGKTFILFKSKRPWEPIVGEQQVFEIYIK
jgi:predicted secreted protein